MNVTIECEACRHSYAVDQSVLGSRAKCSKCGHIFTVPWLPPPDDDPFKNAPIEPTVKPPPAPEPKWKLPPVPVFDSTASNPVEDVMAGKGRAGKDNGAWGIKTATSYLLFLFVAGSVTLGVYETAQVISHMDTTTSVWGVIGNIWAWVACIDVLLFAVNAPMLCLGIWIASKIIRFHLVDGAYLRSCAVAAPATALFVLGTMSQGPARTLCFMSIVPPMFFMLKWLFELDWSEGGVGFAMGAMAWVVAVLAGNVILERVISVGAITQLRASIASTNSGQGSNANDDASSNDGSGNSNASVSDANEGALAQLREIVNQKNSLDYSSATREQLAPDVASFRRTLESLRPRFHHDPRFDDLSREIAAFEQKALALPSGKMDPAVFQDAPDAEDWTTGNLSRGRLSAEVSFQQFKFQPPRDMKIDLHSSEEADAGLAWIVNPTPVPRISISTLPRQDPKQRRPLVSDKPAILHAAESAGLLAFDPTQVTVSSGQINGISFTRVASNGDATPPHSVQYIAATDNDKWLIVRLTLPPGTSPLPKIMEASARTIRKAETGEARSDPLAAPLIAPRMSEDPDRVAALLIKQGASAEGPVLELLKSDSTVIRLRALQVLHDIGTARSLPTLRQLAIDRDQIASSLARQDIAAIQTRTGVPAGEPLPPNPADAAIFDALAADLESEDPDRRKNAVEKLPFVDVDPRHRAAVSHRLASMLKSHDPGVPIADIVKALTTWADPAGAHDFIPLLDEKSDADSRHAAMKVLGVIKAEDAAVPIAKWLARDPRPTSDALIAIGSPAEPAAIAYLMNKSAQARTDAAKILAHIGSRQSLTELSRAAHDSRDPSAQQAARLALEAVRSRAGIELSPTTAPAPGR